MLWYHNYYIALVVTISEPNSHGLPPKLTFSTFMATLRMYVSIMRYLASMVVVCSLATITNRAVLTLNFRLEQCSPEGDGLLLAAVQG